jgi:hypothetical protein
MPNNAQPQQQQQAKPGLKESERGNQGKPGFENEGEGNKTAARNYNKATEEYVRSGRAETAANEAKKALEGPEGDELREAEEEVRNTEPEPDHD